MSDLKFKKTKDGVFVTGLLPGKSNIEKIVIPNKNDAGEVVTGICPGAFEGNKRIRSVSIPQTVRTIGRRAFFGCDGIEELYIENLEAWCGIKLEDEFSQPLFHGQDCYCGLRQINTGNLYLGGELVTDLVIPKTVKVVADNTFAGCTSIKSITSHGDVAEMAWCCFLGLISLESVDFADAKTTISEGTFAYCSSLKGATGMSHLVSIGVSAFQYCSALEKEKFTVPPETSKGKFAFRGTIFA